MTHKQLSDAVHALFARADDLRVRVLCLETKASGSAKAMLLTQPDRSYTPAELTPPRPLTVAVGSRVRNEVAYAVLRKARASRQDAYARRVFGAAYGTVIPRPAESVAGIPTFYEACYSSGERKVYVLCDDGCVRSTRAASLTVLEKCR